MGLWARTDVAAHGAKEGAGEAMSASYLLDFVSFKLGKFVSWFTSYNLTISAMGSRFRLYIADL